jgi:hypothetical protein
MSDRAKTDKAEGKTDKPPIGVVERLVALLGLPILLLSVILLGRSAKPSPTANIVRFYSFDSGVSGEWSRDDVGHALFRPRTESPDLLPTPSKRFFLGPFGAETVDLDLEELPPHQSVTVSLDLFLMGSWDGNQPELGFDRFQIREGDDPDPIFNASFTNAGPGSVTTQSYPYEFREKECPGTTGASEVGTLGFDFRDVPHNSVYRISSSFAHSDDAVRVRFSGAGLNDESWGIDNVTVSASSQLEPIPEPSWAAQCQAPD